MPNLEGLKTKKSRRIVNQQQASEKQLWSKIRALSKLFWVISNFDQILASMWSEWKVA